MNEMFSFITWNIKWISSVSLVLQSLNLARIPWQSCIGALTYNMRYILTVHFLSRMHYWYLIMSPIRTNFSKYRFALVFLSILLSNRILPQWNNSQFACLKVPFSSLRVIYSAYMQLIDIFSFDTQISCGIYMDKLCKIFQLWEL